MEKLTPTFQVKSDQLIELNTPTLKLSRRMALKAGAGVAATSLFGLSACGGGGSSAPALGKVTKVTFNGMSNPATDANRAAVFTNATIDITYENGSVINAAPLSFKTLFRTGDVLKDPNGNDIIAGGYFYPDGITPLIDTSGSTYEQFYSDCVDGTSLLALPNPNVGGITGNTVFAVTQFEYKTSNNAGASQYGRLPSPIAIVALDQSKTTGEMTVKQYFNIPTEDIHGLWIPCAGSLSPWNTHLSSEEYEPDAWLVKLRRSANAALTTTELTGYTSSQLRSVNGNLDYFEAFSTNAFASKLSANPYHYGHVPEVTVNRDGTGSIRKHYCMGRISRELVQVMPDNRTVLMGDDYTNGGMFLFVADVEKVLSSGTLYAAKVTQTSAAQDANGGVFTVEWIKLGSASSLEIEQLANSKTVDQIIDVKYVDPVDPTNYKPVTLDGNPVQWVKVLDTKAAAFLETHRYANYVGATMEFTKFEGVTLNAKDKIAYIAMSRLEKSMSVAGDPTVSTDIDVKKVSAGAIYALTLSGSQTEKGTTTAINSSWVPTAMSVPSVTAPYAGKLIGEDKTIDTDGNTAVVDKIANPDNVKFSENMRTLFIGEDSGQHLNNYVWAYNVDTKVLSRVLSVPAGAECTGLQAVDNLNNYSYVMSAFQHAADWTFGPKTVSGVTVVDQSALNAAVLANYGPSTPSGSAKRAALGYIYGIPVIG